MSRRIVPGIKQTYRFSCPVCGSRLEGESQEFVDIGGKVNKFFCPVCREDRYIPWSSLRKNITYEKSKGAQ